MANLITNTNRDNAFRLASEASDVIDGNRISLNDLSHSHSIFTGAHSMNSQSYLTSFQEPPEQTITFTNSGTETLRLNADGSIYVQGRLAANDLEVVQAMRRFLSGQGLL